MISYIKGEASVENLLKITNVSIAYELKINNASLEYKRGTADLEISRDAGKMTIRTSPIRLQLDTFQARDSISPASAGSFIKRYAQAGKQMAYQATAMMGQEGRMLLKAKLGEDALGQIIQNRVNQSLQVSDIGIEFLPSVPVDINWTKPDMTIDYQMDKLKFDWHILKGDFEFIPGNIEMQITQYPDVIIEYVGDPIYVPPSAAPNAKVDTKA